MRTKPTADFASFDALDIRVGRILEVEEAQTRKPTYRLLSDLGHEIGSKRSCAALRNYSRESLVGQQVICVVNFAPKKMGPETSEVLVLGVPNPTGETILLTPQHPVELGVRVF
jgi:tRNA-binding protein